jgi:hypothetical protein
VPDGLSGTSGYRVATRAPPYRVGGVRVCPFGFAQRFSVTCRPDDNASRGIPNTEVVVIKSLVTLVYLVVGVVIAHSHGYFHHLNGASAIISAILAVVLWPVVLFGGSVHLNKLPKVKVKTKH